MNDVMTDVSAAQVVVPSSFVDVLMNAKGQKLLDKAGRALKSRCKPGLSKSRKIKS